MNKHGLTRARALVAGGICALASCVPAEPTQSGTYGEGPSSPAAAVAEFERLANDARADAGCDRALIRHDGVAAVARAHSEDMRARDYFDHVTPDGRTPMRRVLDAGIGVMAVAENIALGQATGASVFRSWMDSPGHRRNLLDCEYTHHGVGLAGPYWTHVLVRLR